MSTGKIPFHIFIKTSREWDSDCSMTDRVQWRKQSTGKQWSSVIVIITAVRYALTAALIFLLARNGNPFCAGGEGKVFKLSRRENNGSKELSSYCLIEVWKARKISVVHLPSPSWLKATSETVRRACRKRSFRVRSIEIHSLPERRRKSKNVLNAQSNRLPNAYKPKRERWRYSSSREDETYACSLTMVLECLLRHRTKGSGLASVHTWFGLAAVETHWWFDLCICTKKKQNTIDDDGPSYESRTMYHMKVTLGWSFCFNRIDVRWINWSNEFRIRSHRETVGQGICQTVLTRGQKSLLIVKNQIHRQVRLLQVSRDGEWTGREWISNGLSFSHSF